MIFKRKKQNEEEQHLDILDEISEPFSLQNFIDDHIVARYKRFRKLLEDRGILFFLMSPFQYRNRLVIKISLIVLGILIGVVPRTVSLVNETKTRNAESELAQISSSKIVAGRIVVEPLESSQYDKQHLLTFMIHGDTASGVPSTAERFNVQLVADRGVVDGGNIKYAYDIMPISNNQRLLFVYVDNREQNDDTGVFKLYIDVKSDNLSGYDKKPIPIILSNSQTTTTLFDENGIDLGILTSKMTNTGNRTPIADAKEKLAMTLEAYELLDERLRNDGFVIDVNSEAMKKHVNDLMPLAAVKDDSTVRDIKRGSTEYVNDDGTGRPVNVSIVASFTYDNVQYVHGNNDTTADAEERILQELSDLQSLTSAVTDALREVNSAQQKHFNTLVRLQETLNREVDVTKFAETSTLHNDNEVLNPVTTPRED